MINNFPRRAGPSAPSASAPLTQDLLRFLYATLQNYDTMRPHIETLRQALSRKNELSGVERDQAEGLAVYLAPAVRNLTILLQDLAPKFVKLQMGDAPGHAQGWR